MHSLPRASRQCQGRGGGLLHLLNDQVANPVQFGLTNAKDTACPMTGSAATACFLHICHLHGHRALSPCRRPQAHGRADWWKTYAFSDSFHPTPYGHQLPGQLVSRALAQAGWL